jgi:glycosyltransferase involved in cell wall biosynthesis
MLCSVVIPVGNFLVNKQNISLIITSAPKVEFELIVVVDTAGAEGFDEISQMFANSGILNYQVLKSECRNPGGSRNLGKAVAQAEWVIFCDCDDVPDYAGIEAAISEAAESDNVILASFNLKAQSEQIETHLVPTNSEECFLQLASKPGLWRWILRRSLISNIDFQSLSMGEDQLFILEFLIKNPNFKTSKHLVYTYNSEVDGSLTYTKINLGDLAEIIKFEHEKVIADPRIKRLRNYLVFKQLLSLLQHGDFRTKLFSFRTEFRILKTGVILDQFRMLLHLLINRRKNPDSTGSNHRYGIQYVYLMGGLGNQLFQISAGLFNAHYNNRKLFIDETFGNFRKNSDLKPDFRTFKNSEILAASLVDRKITIIGRLIGLLTRLSLESRPTSRQRAALLLLRLFLSALLSISRRRLINVWSSKNLGYEEIPLHQHSQFLVGYFQSYKFASDPFVREQLNSLTVDCPEIDDFVKLAIIERPLVVHIRLGDYLQESKFGTLGIDYYTRALREFFDVSKHPRIWVFSDDIEQAKLLIEEKYLEFVRWFPDIGEPAAVTFEKMRLGHAYILGNSTFSWWSAFLSKTQDAPTIAPTPWFTGLQEPNELIPPNWKRLERDLN